MRWMLVGAIAATAAFSGAEAATVRQSQFGKLQDGSPVTAITLSNAGMTARIINYGAILQSVVVPDRAGRRADVALGYADMTGYIKAPNYFGATVGRYANRIKGATFSIGGKAYRLAANNGPNALHGGVAGFDKHLWQIVDTASGPTAHVTLRYVSPDGEEGYPGTLTATATYSLNERDELTVDYRATTDKPTIVNISNHAYWNLAGEGSGRSILDQLLTIPADSYTPVDDTQIPTGEFRSVAGTPFDFRTPKPIGRDIRNGHDTQLMTGRGYDHNWVIGRQPAAAPRLVARVEEPRSGRILEILSAEPGIQFYSGNFLDGSVVGKMGHIYRQGDGLALEPQLFPDTPNRPDFGSARLDPGQTYENHIVYRFITTKSNLEAPR